MDSFQFEIHAQPDDISCGPTCLHAVYRYFGADLDMPTVLAQVPRLKDGGTLAVHLANHALARGYDARIVTWNLQVFDPTWFAGGPELITDRLLRQAEVKQDPKLREASRAYASFLGLGGKLEFRELDAALLRAPLQRGIPVITGLSATFLYQAVRERPDDQEPDDVGGEPVGHFVVLTGYVPGAKVVHVSDPLYPNPFASSHEYTVGIGRVLGAVYLGALTHDANLLILEPKGWIDQRKP
jgi:hypothetical protein